VSGSGRVVYASSFRLIATLAPPQARSCRPGPTGRSRLYDNPGQVGVVAAPATRAAALAVTPPLAGGITAGRGPCDYVIITSTNLNAVSGEYGLERLRQHRVANGLSAAIVTVQEIYPVYPGRDNAEKVRNFLRDAYVTWGTRYALTGRHRYVPHRTNFYLNGGADTFPADMYYANLEATSTPTATGRFGEIFAGDNDVATNKIDLTAELASAASPARAPTRSRRPSTRPSPTRACGPTRASHNRAHQSGRTSTPSWANRITSSTSTPGFSSDDPRRAARASGTRSGPGLEAHEQRPVGLLLARRPRRPRGIAYFDEAPAYSLANRGRAFSTARPSAA
jgi:hypothetical protein